MNRKLIVGLLAALAAAGIGSGWQLASRHGVTTTLGPFELALLRYGIPGALLCPLLFKTRHEPQASRRALVLLVLGGGLPFGLLVLAGARWAPAAHMGVFMAGSMPLFTALGAWLFKGEKVGGLRLLGLVCIGCGMVFFSVDNLGHASSSWRGDLLFLAAAMLWASYTLAFRHCGLTPWQGAAFVNGWSCVLLLPLVLAIGAPRLQSAPWTDVVLQALGQGVLAGMLGLVVYTAAISRLGAPHASLSAALVPVMTAIGAAWLLNEPITSAMVAALAMVVPGVALASGAFGRNPKTM